MKAPGPGSESNADVLRAKQEARQFAEAGAALVAREILALPELEQRIVELAQKNGLVTLQDALVMPHSGTRAVKRLFNELVRQGYLARHGRGQGAWYAIPQ